MARSIMRDVFRIPARTPATDAKAGDDQTEKEVIGKNAASASIAVYPRTICR
jgi:hypothetical protein